MLITAGLFFIAFKDPVWATEIKWTIVWQRKKMPFITTDLMVQLHREAWEEKQELRKRKKLVSLQTFPSKRPKSVATPYKNTRAAIPHLLCFGFSSFWRLAPKSRLLALKKWKWASDCSWTFHISCHSFNKCKNAVHRRAVADPASPVSFSERPLKASASFPYSHG